MRGLRISVKAAEAEAEARGAEPEPMEVEEGELEAIPVRRSLRELLPVRAAGGAGGSGLRCAPLPGHRGLVRASRPGGGVAGARGEALRH